MPIEVHCISIDRALDRKDVLFPSLGTEGVPQPPGAFRFAAAGSDDFLDRDSGGQQYVFQFARNFREVQLQDGLRVRLKSDLEVFAN
jgi:hypothetical protein